MIIMKKFIGLLLTGMFILGGLATQAQTSDKAYLLNASAIGVDKAAVRATRDFWHRAGEQKEEQWYKSPRGYVAEYEAGPVKGRFVYNQKGDWSYSILTYGEKQLPEEVRQQVRSSYYDYGITWVKEVDEDDAVVYVVHLEGEASWKEVAVQNGEMRVLKAMYKQ
jgi:hypothetical protein